MIGISAVVVVIGAVVALVNACAVVATGGRIEAVAVAVVVIAGRAVQFVKIYHFNYSPFLCRAVVVYTTALCLYSTSKSLSK